MKRLLLLFFAAFVTVLAVGCDRTSNDAQSKPGVPRIPSRNIPVHRYTEAELNKMIVSGMSLEDVTNRFGLPSFVAQATNNYVFLEYMYPFEVPTPEDGAYMAGFDIDLKDDRVVRWSPVLRGIGEEIPPAQSTNSFGRQRCAIYVLLGDPNDPNTDAMRDVLKSFRSKGTADMDSVKRPADMTFEAEVVAHGTIDSRGQRATYITLKFNDADVPKMKRLTEDHINDSILLVCRDKPMKIINIREPINQGTVTFRLDHPAVLDALTRA